MNDDTTLEIENQVPLETSKSKLKKSNSQDNLLQSPLISSRVKNFVNLK